MGKQVQVSNERKVTREVGEDLSFRTAKQDLGRQVEGKICSEKDVEKIICG